MLVCSMRHHTDPFLTSADVARRANVVPATVRGWARRGVLVPAMVTPGGIRLFRACDAERMARAVERERRTREARRG